jgi:chromosomal replication initiator protein
MVDGSWRKFIIEYEKTNKSPVLIPILKKTYIANLEDNNAYVACENLGMKIILESKKNNLEKEISRILNKQLSLNFVIKGSGKKKPNEEMPLLKYEENKHSAIESSGLQTKYTFDNFAVSSSNQFAYVAALSVSKNPGNSYNPLFVYGDVGVGKTHLVQAIANKILENDLTKKIYYCPSEEFVNDLVELIRIKNTSHFRQKYRFLDVLLIDDVQFIAGKNAVQEEFFHTFNFIIKRGGQIILSSDKPPQEIKKLEDRLRSRFAGGLTVDIQKPDIELRTAILLIKAKERNIEIDTEAAGFIAEKIIDTRELEGKLLEVYARCLKEKGRITTDIIKKEFSKKNEQTKNKLSPQDVIKYVCSFYQIRPSQIKDKGRKENIVLPRQIIMFILRNILKLNLEEIAFILKRKDHTTIIHGVDKITSLVFKNPVFKEEVNRIISSLSLST